MARPAAPSVHEAIAGTGIDFETALSRRISIGQFGNFVPQLGDGQAILFGEEVLDRNGERRDVQLKGAGRTPFSRARRRPRRPSEYRGLSWGNVADGEISERQRADTLGRD
jgi:Protein adenylyltransferase SelO